MVPVLLKRHCLSAVHLGMPSIAAPVPRTILFVYKRGGAVSKGLPIRELQQMAFCLNAGNQRLGEGGDDLTRLSAGQRTR